MTTGSTGDHAVILARGASARMGAPKGLVRLPGDGLTFLERIAGLYDGCGIPVTVVTLQPLAAAYREALVSWKQVRVVEADAGGGTAKTLLAGWKSLAKGKRRTRRIWVHPVDLPLVQSSSLSALAAAGRTHPGRIIRPMYQDAPGHPVLVPAAVLEILADRREWVDARLQSFFAHGAEAGWFLAAVEVAVDDAGVIRDFDTPADLAQFERKGKP